MVGELNERVKSLEGGRSAPPNLGAPQHQFVTPPLGRNFHGRHHQYVPPPIPPFRGGHGGRGQGRGDARQRLYEQEWGTQAHHQEEDPMEEGFGEFGERDDQRPPPRNPPPRPNAPRGRDFDEEFDEDYLEDRYGTRPQPRPYNPRGRFYEEDEFKDIKINIPSFNGARNPEVYLEWERKVELAFEFRECTERKRLKLITQEFSGYALTWWDDLNKKRMRNEEGPITTWLVLRREMRARFVPSNYEREIHQKLQWLTQGAKSVEEYYEEMQTLMLRANLEEHEEAIMARFSRGLNREIYNIVELQPYSNMEELLDKASKVERQLRVARFKGASSSSPYQRGTWNKGEIALKRPMETTKPPKAEPTLSKPQNQPFTKPWQNQPSTQQSKYPPTLPSKTKDITCFKCQGKGHYARECPNKRVLLVDEFGEYYSASEDENETVE